MLGEMVNNSTRIVCVGGSMKNAVMKYLSFGKTVRMKNMGDYIQSIAANQFMKASLLIERERLDEYDGEPIKLIMNGWWMHQPCHFPPSEKIQPLLVSMHIRPSIADEMLSERVVAWLKKHGPVGCRDRNTVQILKDKGVDAYYSSCLTLTLGETYKHEDGDGEVLFVDPMFMIDHKSKCYFRAVCTKLLSIVVNAKTIFKIGGQLLNISGQTGFARRLLSGVDFWLIYSRCFSTNILKECQITSNIVNEDIFHGEEEKFNCADAMLKRFSRAKLVVTSRIHAALPCLAMETPTVFVYHSSMETDGVCTKGRLDGIIELLNTIEVHRDMSLTANISLRISSVKDVPVRREYRQYANNLRKLARKFAKSEAESR